ncbi:MAG: L,D-transpeptidase [Terriglobales bacterium]
MAACTGPTSSGSFHGPDLVIAITPDATADTNPRTPIQVKVTGGTLSAATVTSPSGHGIDGAFANDKTSWSTTDVLGYGKTYQVSATAVGGNGEKLTKTATLHTVTPKAQIYPSVIPNPGGTDIGVGQPLRVQFDHDVPDRALAQKLLNVTSVPSQPGAWYWISDRIADYRPQGFWQAGSKITLDIKDYGVDFGGGLYGQEDRTVTYSVHDSWVAYADGGTEQMVIKHNGEQVKTMPISMGKDETPTHAGTHVISHKDVNYTMNSCSYGVCGGPKAYVAVEHYAVRISNDGEFVHENPNSVGSQGNSNVSHGCINLNEENAVWFFNHFNAGDVVIVTNSGGQALPLDDLWGDWSIPWSKWSRGNADK